MTILIKDIVQSLENFAIPAYAESYDNVGLLVGDTSTKATGVLLCLDITEEIMQEAIDTNCNLIVSHHPIVFSGLKRFNGKNMVERCVMTAIKNDIAIYASHTNMDSAPGGVNDRICDKLGLIKTRVLAPMSNHLCKLVAFAPIEHAQNVRDAIFTAGAGNIGNYDACSFSSEGNGTFRGNENSNAFVGEKGETHTEAELRIETIFPKHLKRQIISALLRAHPYEEVAYDIIALSNDYPTVGLGRVGELPEAIDELEFLRILKEKFECEVIRHTERLNKPIRTVAVCGGAGSSLLGNAIASQADVFVTGDFKYHDFFSAEGKLLVADIGHYESEQYTKEVFYEILTKKFPNFAVRLTGVNNNPVNYFK